MALSLFDVSGNNSQTSSLSKGESVAFSPFFLRIICPDGRQAPERAVTHLGFPQTHTESVVAHAGVLTFFEEIERSKMLSAASALL